jgi:hypothetical protein
MEPLTLAASLIGALIGGMLSGYRMTPKKVQQIAALAARQAIVTHEAACSLRQEKTT